jgi:hypothetical protein
MNQDAVINQLAHITGASRKQVIDALNKMKSIPEVRNYLDKSNLAKSGSQKKPDG